MRKLTLTALVVTFLAAGSALLVDPRSRAAEPAPDAAKPEPTKPIETGMHQLMEYYFQPSYVRLKERLAAEPADKAAWRAVKGDALVLAEGGNLLLSRVPAKDGKDWIRHSIESRDAAEKMYAASKKKDYKGTRENFVLMLGKCNACHTQFANGKHQLAP